MKNINGFERFYKARFGILKALCLSVFFLGLILVICVFILPKYMITGHKLGNYTFTNNQEIDVNVAIDVSNDYKLYLSFPTKQFEEQKDWDVYGFGDRLPTIRNGKPVNPGLPISLRFNITSEDNITRSFTAIAGGYSGCAYFRDGNISGHCRSTKKAFFMSKGVNSIKLMMSAKEDFFQEKEFQLQLFISKKTSPQTSFIYKLWLFSGNNLLLIALFSLLTFVPYIIIDIKTGYK